jgi:protein arginine kinase activator
MNPQKCDRCDRPAVVHEVTVKSGIKTEIHLCQEHAMEAGVSMPTHQPINQLLTKFVVSQAGKARTKARKKTCPSCGMTFAQFRQSGTLGCPDCYKTFESQLGPLIERAQNDATHHRGKTPRRAGASLDRQLQLQQLVKELDQAVAAEQYERAAQLRDRLRSFGPEASAAPGGGEPAAETET